MINYPNIIVETEHINFSKQITPNELFKKFAICETQADAECKFGRFNEPKIVDDPGIVEEAKRIREEIHA